MKPHHLLLLFGAALSAASTLGAADETVTTYTFSDPARPGQLRAVIGNGDVRIRGDDVDQVTIRTSAERDDSGEQREDGLRVIATSAQFSAIEKDNVLSLEYGTLGWSHGAEFDIVVPRNTSIQLQSNFGGEISIEDVAGDVEIKNMNGEIELQRLGGGAIVETMNGEIDASFTTVPEGKPLAFSSMNGEIKLHLPADAKANVRFRTQNGAILTDFPADVLVTKTEQSGAQFAPMSADMARAAGEAAREAMEVARAVAEEVRVAVATEVEAMREHRSNGSAPSATPRPPRAPRPPSIPPMAGGKVVSGTLNGGGSDIQIATMNGDIVVRKLTTE